MYLFSEKIKNNKLLSIVTFFYIGWLFVLLLLAIFGYREVIFYDALNKRNVSSSYSSEVPLIRYFIEPIYGINLIFAQNLDFVQGFIISFIILRVITYYLEKTEKIKSEKLNLLWYPIKDFIRFSFLIIVIFVTGGVIFVLILLAIGFFYVNLYWMTVLQILMPLAFFILLIKGILLLWQYSRPEFRFNYLEKKRYVQKRNAPKTTKSRIQIGIRREGVYLGGTLLLLIGMNILLVSTYFPCQHISTDLDDDEFLFDFHVHCTMSDGWVSAEERVQWYIDHGIDGAAFSDHDNLRGSKAAQRYVEENNLDFTVIISEEWTNHQPDPQIHMNIFGLTETIVPLESENSAGVKAMNTEDTIKYVKRNGGYIFVNHYSGNYLSDESPYTLKELRDWGVDGFEIMNGGGYQNDGYKEIRNFCLENNLTCIGGSDIHKNNELNTVVKLKLDNPNDKSVDNIFENLARNDHEVVSISTMPEKVEYNPAVKSFVNDLGFGMIFDASRYFLNLDTYQVLSWMIWSTGGFAFFFIVYKKVKRLDVEVLRYKIL